MNSDIIGKIVSAKGKYYNLKEKKYDFKRRPFLVIGIEENKTFPDLNVLPISTIKKDYNVNEFDYRLDKDVIKKLKLKEVSYIRINKQTVINSRDLETFKNKNYISNLKSLNNDIYNDIISLYNKHQGKLF